MSRTGLTQRVGRPKGLLTWWAILDLKPVISSVSVIFGAHENAAVGVSEVRVGVLR